MIELGKTLSKLAEFQAACDSLIGTFNDVKRPFEASIMALQRIRALPIESVEILSQGIRECNAATASIRAHLRGVESIAAFGEQFLELERTLQWVVEGQKR
ncbi:MAG TPA: hypothetical protein VKS22_12130 [Candidatus Binataceae bacterium]|nr:hypothetical protein [Candidatus Binataceae bacterium]